MKTRQAKGAFAQKIPIEGLDVAQIKNNAMALRDRPLVERFLAENCKQFIRGGSRLDEAKMMIVASAD